jgi:hypothetical protein
MTFTAISQVKGLNDLQFEPHFSYDRYEKMEELGAVVIKKMKKID